MNKLKKYLKDLILFTLVFYSLFAEATSLYDLKSVWLDTQNKEVSLSIHKGSYVLISMVYTGCAHSCPMTISKIQNIEKDFSKAGFENIKIILASFDVKNDRPKKLKKYQLNRKLDLKQWSFLSAKSEAEARELAVVLGINYKSIGGGEFSHSNVISLLDQNGKIIGSIDSLSASSDGLIKGLKESINKEPPK